MSDAVLIARILAGSWRASPPPPDFSVRDLGVTELRLLESGAGGLAWWRIHDDPSLAGSQPGERLRDAFRMHSIHARLHEDGVLTALEALRAGGVEPLLIKGWSAARMYPDPAMRPYGDIDLWVRDRDLQSATLIVDGLPDGIDVDLEHDVELTGSRLDDLFSRSQLVAIGEREISVLAPEDSLRVLAIHFLKNGGWRPSSLCDVAAAVEGRGARFDWDRCLTTDHVAGNWVSTAVSLAGRLLGADLRGTPPEGRRCRRWLLRAVLNAWSDPRPERYNAVMDPLARLTHPVRVAGELARRWPLIPRLDPITATVAMGARFGSSPRLPLQIGYLGLRAGRYLTTQGDRGR